MNRLLALVTLLLAVAPHNLSAQPVHLTTALKAQRELVAASPDDPGALNDLANLLVLGGRLEEAESVYQQALYWAPDSGTVHYNFGLLYQQQDRHEKAVAEFARAVEARPDNAWAYYQMGLSLEALGTDRQATIDAYARAFYLDPQLAFADVNPQVIDSRFLTPAMLRAHRQAPGRVVAPLSYREPKRIAEILLPPLPPDLDAGTEAAGSPETDSHPSAAGPADHATGSDPAGLPVELTDTQQQRARALARSQRQHTPTNRATPPVDDPTRAEPADGKPADSLFDDWETETDPGAAEDFFGDYSPQPESTGRLEWRLLPASGEPQPDSPRQANAARTTPESTRGR